MTTRSWGDLRSHGNMVTCMSLQAPCDHHEKSQVIFIVSYSDSLN